MPFTTVHVINDQITKIWCGSLKIDAGRTGNKKQIILLANTLSDFTVEVNFCAFTRKL